MAFSDANRNSVDPSALADAPRDVAERPPGLRALGGASRISALSGSLARAGSLEDVALANDQALRLPERERRKVLALNRTERRTLGDRDHLSLQDLAARLLQQLDSPPPAAWEALTTQLLDELRSTLLEDTASAGCHDRDSRRGDVLEPARLLLVDAVQTAGPPAPGRATHAA